MPISRASKMALRHNAAVSPKKSKRPYLTALFFAIAVVTMTKVDATEVLAPDSAEIDAYLKNTFHPDGPGATVLVMKDGKSLLSKGYGLANIENKVPVTADTVFHAASVGKQFTAAAIMQLADQGKLDIKAPINKYFPDVPKSWDGIKVENLLTHTSGIPNLFNDPPFRARKGADMSAEDQFKYAISLPLLAEPGTQFNYSSANYVILSILIHQISGQNYEDYIREKFLTPLDMNHTSFDQDSRLIPSVATPYGPGPSRADYISPTLGIGAGSYFTTTADLAKWTTALFGGKILSPTWVKIMTTEFQLKDGTKVHYGYGLRPHRFHGDYIESTGDIPGFHSDTVYLPDAKIYVAILTNGEDLSWYTLPLLTKELTIMAQGGKVEKPKAIDLPKAALDLVAGQYQAHRWVRKIKVVDDHLVFEDGDGQIPATLMPISATEFFYQSEPDLHVRFVIENGRAISMQMYEPNAVDEEQDSVSPRIPDKLAN